MNDQELRELDAWIAEHVMGWTKWEGSGWLHAGCMDANGIKWLSGGYEIEFQPTIDSGQSMDVLKRCGERMPNFHIGAPQGSSLKNWMITWNYDENTVESETLELAICLFSKQLFSK